MTKDFVDMVKSFNFMTKFKIIGSDLNDKEQEQHLSIHDGDLFYA